jgi:DnaA family protein
MQLPLQLIDPPLPSLTNGVIGRNQAALEALRQAADRSALAADPIYLWGAPGSGKSFWLAAWAAALGVKAALIQCGRPETRPAEVLIGLAQTQDEAGQGSGRVLLVDDVDAADPETAAALFQIYNLRLERGDQLIFTASAPPLRLSLRDDLRTRLGQSLIYELHELNDDEKKEALRSRARRLGWTLSEEVLSYLMTRLPRDLGLLIRVIDSADQFSLSYGRVVTIPLVKALLDSADATRPI